MKKNITNPHDRFFRASMQDIRVAREFLEAHLPEELQKQIDLTTLKASPETFVDEELKLSQSDVILHTMINGQPGFIYVLVEHQSTIDFSMPLRLLKYMVKIWEHFQDQHKKSKDLIYPVIMPMVFYTGKKPYIGKTSMWDLCGDNSAFMHQVLSNSFCLIDVNTISDEELKQRLFSGSMEFVMRYQFRQHIEEQLLQLMDNFVRLALDNNDQFLLKLLQYILIIDNRHDSIQSLMMAIQNHAPPSIRGNIMGLAEKIYLEGEEKGIEKGIEQGFRRGTVECVIQLAKNMLIEGAEVIFVAKVTKLPLNKVKKIQSELV